MKIPNVEDVIEEIVKLRYEQSKSTLTIVNHLKKKYGLNKTRAYEIVRLARAKVGELHRKMNENVLEEAIASLEAMKERARLNFNGKLELEVQKELNKVQQLYKEIMEINVKQEQPLFGEENEDGEE